MLHFKQILLLRLSLVFFICNFLFVFQVKHNISWDGMWRTMGVGNKYASFEVRKDSGHTFKSSLKHIVTSDTRDSPIFPTGGSLIKLTTELAGLGGDVAYLKNEFNFQINRPIVTSDFVSPLHEIVSCIFIYIKIIAR